MDYLQAGQKGKNDWWRYLIGIVIIILASQILSGIPLEIYFASIDTTSLTEVEYYEYMMDWDFENLGLNKNMGLAVLISGFALNLLVLFLVYRYLHQKNFMDIINGIRKIRWNKIGFGVLVWGAFLLAELFVDLLINPGDYQVQFQWSSFIPLFFVCIFLLPIQTSYEEFLFRGYLLQGIGNFSKYAIIPVVITSLLFSAGHMWNPEPAAFGYGLMFLYYFAFAFGLAVITIWDKGIEIAIGVHAINNILGALTVTYEDAVLQTDSIWQVTIHHIGWLDIMIYVLFFVLLVYAYYFWYGRKNPLPESFTNESSLAILVEE